MAGVTKKAIAEAFLLAAQQKPIDKVTVKDVVGICGITRQTFYYHFQDLLEFWNGSWPSVWNRCLQKHSLPKRRRMPSV